MNIKPGVEVVHTQKQVIGEVVAHHLEDGGSILHVFVGWEMPLQKWRESDVMLWEPEKEWQKAFQEPW